MDDNPIIPYGWNVSTESVVTRDINRKNFPHNWVIRWHYQELEKNLKNIA